MNTAWDRRKGSAFETKVVAFLRERGWTDARKAERRGKNDQGDIDGFPVVLQCKYTTAEELGRALDDTEQQALRAGKEFYAVVRHRKRKGIELAYVTMPLGLFSDLVEYASDHI